MTQEVASIPGSTRSHDCDDETMDEESSCCCCHCGAGKEGSKNKSYQKMKEHLQQRLRAKSHLSGSSAGDSSVGSRSSSSKSHANGDADLDYLVNFIEGGDKKRPKPKAPNPKKLAKKAQQREKRMEQKRAEELAAAAAAAQQATRLPAKAKSQPTQPQDRVPNGMVKITHNPLTNSAVITPLYGPLEPNPSYLQPPLGLAGPNPLRMAPPAPAPPPSRVIAATSPPLPVPNLQQQQQPSSQPQQMVTIRRVMQPNLSEPVVTVTLKGDTPDYDRVLFTLVNGQVLPTGAKPSDTGATVPANPPIQSKSNTPAAATTATPPVQSNSKSKKKEKKKQKKLLKKAQLEAQNQPQLLQAQPEPPPPQYQQQFPTAAQRDFSLDNFRLPPGITLTRVQQGTAHSAVGTHPDLPMRMLDRTKRETNGTSPIALGSPKSKESMGSLGGLAAPNVIVVDTRKIQQQPEPSCRTACQASQVPVKMCSVAVQTGWDEDDDVTPFNESQMSKKQRKLMRRKEKQLQEQAVLDRLAAMQINGSKKSGKKVSSTANNSSTARAATLTGAVKISNGAATKPVNSVSVPATNGVAPAGKSKKKKKKGQSAAGGANGVSSEDKWEENVFVPKSDLDLEGGDLDDDERELEAFKRFCFNTVPPERKEKVKIHLNVKDIFGKKSNGLVHANNRAK